MPGCEVQCLDRGRAGGERIREDGREVVPHPVGVHQGARCAGRSVAPRGLATTGEHTAAMTFGTDHEIRRPAQQRRVAPLGRVAAAAHHRVDPDTGIQHGGEFTRRHHEHPGLTGPAQQGSIPGGEEHRVEGRQFPQSKGSAAAGCRRSPRVIVVRSPDRSTMLTAARVGPAREAANTRTPRRSSSARERCPAWSSPKAVKNVQPPVSSASRTAATAPPPAGPRQSRSAWITSPAAGTWSRPAIVVHST